MVQCYSTGDGNVSFHKGTLAPTGEYDWTCVHPLAHSSPQPIRHLDRFSRLCTDDRGVSIFTMVCLFSLKIAPSDVGIWTSFNTWFTGPTRVRNANSNLIVSAVFAGLTDWQRQKDRQTTLLNAVRRNSA